MNSPLDIPDALYRDEPRFDANGDFEPRPDDLSNLQSPVPLSNQINPVALSSPIDTPNNVPDETTRPDAVEPAQTRSDTAERDETRRDTFVREQTSVDQEEHYMEEPLTNWVDVELASVLLREQGVSRTIRTIQKMCKRGDFEAKLVPTEHGVRYIISEKSIEEFIIRHNEKLPSGSLGEEEVAQSAGLNPNHSSEPVSAISSSQSEPQMEANQPAETSRSHLREIIDLKDQQITMMQSQIDIANAQLSVKDEQIATMHERDHETNVLIQNLQSLMGLPKSLSGAGWQANSTNGLEEPSP